MRSSHSDNATEAGGRQAHSMEPATSSHITTDRQSRPVCPVCAALNREQSRFCAECGASLFRYCPHCGQRISADLESCPNCPLEAGQPTLPAGSCQRCGFQSDPTADLCGRCGARLLSRCPQCDALNIAAISFCPRCGFNYSHLVTRALAHRLELGDETAPPSRRILNYSSALMIALVALSVLVMLYILWQI